MEGGGGGVRLWVRTRPTRPRPAPAAPPTHHVTICEMLSLEPLEPDVAMTRGGLSRGISAMHMLPILSRSLERMPLSSASSDCSSSQPGCSLSVPSLKLAIDASHSR